MERCITFTTKDIRRFSEISLDQNPLHVDDVFARKSTYGQRIVHGILAAMCCVRELKENNHPPLCQLEIEFHNPVFINIEYRVLVVQGKDDCECISVSLLDGSKLLIKLSCFFDKRKNQCEAGLNFLNQHKTAEITPTIHPHSYTDLELSNGVSVAGSYHITDDGFSAFYEEVVGTDCVVRPVHAKLMMACSYIIGMQLPGKNALFTKLSLNFCTSGNHASSDFEYLAETSSFDKLYRQLQIKLLIGSAKRTLAKGQLTAFVRMPISSLSLESIHPLIGSAPDRFKNKVVLVIGGSRGLGAAIVKILVLQGCHVILAYKSSSEDAVLIEQDLKQAPGTIELIQGDAGSERWCRTVLSDIESRLGRLDILIGNACSPPQSIVITSESLDRVSRYIADNLALVSIPLTVFLSLLSDNKGCFIGISSSILENGVSDWPHYQGLKHSVEALVQSTAKVHQEMSFVIARPPALLTDLNNTPFGTIGALPPEIAAATIVDYVADLPLIGNYHLIKDFRKKVGIIDNTDTDLISNVKYEASKPANKILKQETEKFVIASTFTIDPIQTSLEFWSQELDLQLQIEISPYNQTFQELLNPQSSLSQNQSGINCIIFRFEDWFRYMHREIGDDFEMQSEYFEQTLSVFLKAIKSYSERSNGFTLLIICPSRSLSPNQQQWNSILGSLGQKLVHFIKDLNGFDILNVADFHDKYGVDNPFDTFRDEVAHIPFSSDYFHFLGTVIVRRVFSLKSNPFKVIVVDCDNTLWSGVCGEVGPKGVNITGVFYDFQKFLIKQSEHGLLLCLCSKNSETDVWQVFKEQQNMPLKKDHIVDSRINWVPKSENIKSLAASLKLGLESFIFIDDNPLECAEVRANCPEVLTVQWFPDSEKLNRQLMNHLWIFDRYSLTEEDKKRTQLYKTNVERDHLQDSYEDFAEFIKQLELKVSITPLKEKNVARVAQLTQRTNQFNFSTVRRSQLEIGQLLDDRVKECYTVTIADRFGSYGLVGVLIVEKQLETLVLDSFILSCRVLGRGVEHRMINFLGEIAETHQLPNIKIIFKPSQKNHPAKQFIENIVDFIPEEADEQFSFLLLRQEAKALVFDPQNHVRENRHNSVEKKSATATSFASPLTRQIESKLIHIALHLNGIKFLAEAVKRFCEGKVKTENRIKATNHVKDETFSDSVNYQQLLKAVKEIVARILKVDPEDIDDEENLGRYQISSFHIVEIMVDLNKKFHGIPATLLFDHLTISSVVDYIAEQQGIKWQNREAAGPDKSSKDQLQPVRLEKNEHKYVSKTEDIAIIGIDGKFPQAPTLDQFWVNLKEGKSSITEIPNNRWDVASFFDRTKKKNKSYCKWGGFLENVDYFEPAFFHISPLEAIYMDPQQRLLLETVWRTIEDAGYTPDSISCDTGVFIGVVSNDYNLFISEAALRGDSNYRNADTYQIANRISYFFDFHGPSLSIDTACSASGSALYLACESLVRNECRSAIVGGVNLILHPSRLIQYSQMNMLSADESCRPFGEGATGTLLGEGIGALLLKPLNEAEKDRDQIHGVIKGWGVNSGGRTNGFTVPNQRSQEQLLSKTLDKANIKAETISYFEAHGTGTKLGDPLEIKGLTDAFSQQQEHDNEIVKVQTCAIGSVKSNIGHLESAAAIASIIKVLLQMKHKQLVPSLNAEIENSHIAFKETPFFIQRNYTDWIRPVIEKDGIQTTIPRRAGINSFGAGGSNSVILLEEYKYPELSTPCPAHLPQLIVFSAENEEKLAVIIKQMIAYLLQGDCPETEPYSQHNNNSFSDTDTLRSFPSLEDIAYTLQVGRKAMQERLALIVSGIEELKSKLTIFSNGAASIDGLYRGNTSLKNEMEILVEGNSGMGYVEAILKERELQNIAKLWISGINLDWKLLYTGRKPYRVSLPTYPFCGKRYWIDINANRVAESRKAIDLQIHSRSATQPAGFTYLPKWEYVPDSKERLADTCYLTPNAEKRKFILIVYGPKSTDLKDLLAIAHGNDKIFFLKSAGQTKQVNDQEYEVRYDNTQSINQVLADLKPPDVVYFLCEPTGIEAFKADLEMLKTSQEKGVIFLFRLIKGLSKLNFIKEGLHIKVVTSDVHHVLAGDKTNPFHGAIPGFVRSVAPEYPMIKLQSIDISSSECSKDLMNGQKLLLGKLVNLQLNSEQEIETSLRGGKQYLRTLFPLAEKTISQHQLRKQGTYLILGGAGGIGLELCRFLAKSVNAQLALIGRSNLTDKQKRSIKEIETYSGQILYFQADGTDLAAMFSTVKKVKSRFGEINGVIHAAIVLQDKILENMDELAFHEAFDPKVSGSFNLFQVVKKEPLDFMLFFSSIISFQSNPGQCNYSAGCSFKDAFARYLDQVVEFPVKTINWGYWGTVGIVSSEAYNKRMAAQQIHSILPEEGIKTIAECLCDEHQQFVPIKAEPTVLKKMGVDFRYRLKQYPRLKPPTLNTYKARIAFPSNADGLFKAYEKLDNFAQHLVLNLFLQSGVFKTPNYWVETKELMEDMHWQSAYKRLFTALLSILEKSAFIETDSGSIRLTKNAIRQSENDLLTQKQNIQEQYPVIAAHLELLWQCINSYREIISGEIPPTEVIFKDSSLDLIKTTYGGNAIADYFNEILAGSVVDNIKLRQSSVAENEREKIAILEIGAGTGSTTKMVLDRIAFAQNNISYTYTDISSLFVLHGKELLNPKYPFLEFKTLNIEEDVLTQGFAEDFFDIIIGTNVLHATKRIDDTLQNVKRMLKRNGWLILNEAVEDQTYLTVVYGLLTGWWLFEDGNKRIRYSPLLNVDQWQKALEDNGFSNFQILESSKETREKLFQTIMIAESNGEVKIKNQVKNEKLTEKVATKKNGDRSLYDSKQIFKGKISEANPIELVISQNVAEALQMNEFNFNLETSYSEFGVDSISAIAIANKINKQLGIDLKSTDLYNYPTIKLLSDHITELLATIPIQGEGMGENTPANPELEDGAPNDFSMLDPIESSHSDENLAILHLLKKLESGELDIDEVDELTKVYYG